MMIRKVVEILKSIKGIRRRRSQREIPFNVVFSYFKDILNNNNRAIEIIADMGDKLSGDYLFDINYVKNAYTTLSEAIADSLRSFDILTENKYPELHDIIIRIDNRIKKMIYGEERSLGGEVTVFGGEGTVVETPLVCFFEDITSDMRQAVGGKNTNLAEIKNYLKLKIPDGFVITTAAYEQFIKHNGIDKEITKFIQENNLSGLRRLILNGDIPVELDRAIDGAIKRMREMGHHRVAIRSSAEEEDSDVSFAGQFETILNVPLEKEMVEDAYKEVISSLFSERAIAYQRRFGFEPGSLRMAVGCLAMVDARVSGVIYTDYYIRSTGGEVTVPGILINASWGLGKSIVEGHVDPDYYFLSKETKPRLIEKRIGRKERLTRCRNNWWGSNSWWRSNSGGIEEIDTPDDLRDRACLTEEEVIELARIAMIIERHFGRPQDIEWAIDNDGRIFLLQSRPLTILGAPRVTLSQKNHEIFGDSTGEEERETPLQPSGDDEIIMGKGIIVQKGVGAGRAFILRNMEELDRFPKGAVLVARHDSSEFVRIMPYAAAIVTDVGNPTSHMASLSREFRIPTIVNAENATVLIKNNEEITVKADEEGICIYRGIKRELLEKANMSQKMLDDIYEFRKKRYILRHITPLNLTDPLREDFTPEGCKTLHDVLRFIHEKSVEELIEKAEKGAKGYRPIRLRLPIPAGISVIDIGGALKTKPGERAADIEEIVSVPLRAIVKGMVYPGAWHSDMIALSLRDFMTGMMRAPEITAETTINSHVAIASAEYLNLSLRFGYHLNMLDCYCSENPRNNHIYFRFMGGATDITKRTRRIKLIAIVLREFGFSIKTEGDVIIARLGNIGKDEMESILDHLGRLIAYTRQLDAVLHDDSAVERYARKFMEGEYEI